jgi:hypothetical protein
VVELIAYALMGAGIVFTALIIWMFVRMVAWDDAQAP